MLSRVTSAVVCLLMTMGEAASQSGYAQKLRHLSFDMSLMREYPVGWQTTGSAVPIATKVKVLPKLPQTNGQMFISDELATPAWTVSYRLKLQEGLQLKNLKISEMVDLFAVWYLLGNPRIRPNSINNNMTFGFRETFNGVGIFVFKESKDYRLIAVENHGNEQITMAKLSTAFQEGVNGCTLSDSALDRELVLTLRMEQGQLTVTHGLKMRQSSHKTCLKDLYMPNLAARGYLGITARNSDRYDKSVELNSVKVINHNPAFYAQEEEVPIEDPMGQEERQQGQVYTDEMEGGQDLIEMHEQEQEELDRFINEHLGNIRADDSEAEALFKMNEHMKKALYYLTDFIKNEEMMQHYVKDHERLPQITRTFEQLPEAIENESSFINTIDYQLQRIKEFFGETVQKALDVQSNNLTEVPGGQALALPNQANTGLLEVQGLVSDTKNVVGRLAQQQNIIVPVLNKMEELKGSAEKKENTGNLLELAEGIGWSKEVFDEIEWRLDSAKQELITLAKSNSQWRSLIQTLFIIFASISVGLVWVKLNDIASKGIL